MIEEICKTDFFSIINNYAMIFFVFFKPYCTLQSCNLLCSKNYIEIYGTAFYDLNQSIYELNLQIISKIICEKKLFDNKFFNLSSFPRNSKCANNHINLKINVTSKISYD